MKKALRSFAIFLLTYILLLLPQTGINDIYTGLLCRAGNFCFHNFSNDGIVKLKPKNDQGKNDIALFISRSSLVKDGKASGMTYNKASDLIGFLPLALLLSLIVATPLSWKRKSIALLLGFILMMIFTLVKLRIIIQYSFVVTPWIGLYQDSPAKESVLSWYQRFGAPMTPGFSFAVILWLCLCIGKREWQWLNTSVAQMLAPMKPVENQKMKSKFQKPQRLGRQTQRPVKENLRI